MYLYHASTQSYYDDTPPPRAMIPILKSGLHTCLDVAENKPELNC